MLSASDTVSGSERRDSAHQRARGDVGTPCSSPTLQPDACTRRAGGRQATGGLYLPAGATPISRNLAYSFGCLQLHRPEHAAYTRSSGGCSRSWTLFPPLTPSSILLTAPERYTLLTGPFAIYNATNYCTRTSNRNNFAYTYWIRICLIFL